MPIRRTLAALILSAAVAPAFAQTADDYVEAPMPSYSEPIIVTEASDRDDAITRNVVDVLVNDSRLAGRIGVQTVDQEVELTGIVTSPGQWRQAERDAKSVYGVRHVHNKLATRIGGGRF